MGHLGADPTSLLVARRARIEPSAAVHKKQHAATTHPFFNYKSILTASYCSLHVFFLGALDTTEKHTSTFNQSIKLSPIMHRTYSMRQSRAPTASQIQNPPPPASSTKSGRFFGKSSVGESRVSQHWICQSL